MSNSEGRSQRCGNLFKFMSGGKLGQRGVYDKGPKNGRLLETSPFTASIDKPNF